MGVLYVVGLGPGDPRLRTPEATKALSRSTSVGGYSVYLDLIREEFPEKEYFSTPMRGELERCRMALSRAAEGETVSLVCSGDAGIYGMAGPVFTLLSDYPGVAVEVVPGLTAATAGAACLGAPLTNDFCVVSLSDLLTPWEVIEGRLRAAARGDFVLALYNPASRRRTGHLKRAVEILLSGGKAPETPCGYVRNIGREGEQAFLCTLAELPQAEVDMFTTVFVGNSRTKMIAGRMVTERGYPGEGSAALADPREDSQRGPESKASPDPASEGAVSGEGSAALAEPREDSQKEPERKASPDPASGEGLPGEGSAALAEPREDSQRGPESKASPGPASGRGVLGAGTHEAAGQAEPAGWDRRTPEAFVKILIFGGTTEGRRLAEALSERIASRPESSPGTGELPEILVSVATPAGAEELSGIPRIRVLTGRRDAEAMAALMEGVSLAVDATHPYAVEASRNIRRAALGAGVPCLRILRAEGARDAAENASGKPSISVPSSAEDASGRPSPSAPSAEKVPEKPSPSVPLEEDASGKSSPSASLAEGASGKPSPSAPSAENAPEKPAGFDPAGEVPAQEKSGVSGMEPALKNVRWVDSVGEAAELLSKTEGNILITTGAKELQAFAKLEPGRLFVRVLPMEASLGACRELGLPMRNILAMRGPFSEAMNLAMLRDYDISWLVTKDGGREGGFQEKIAAANAACVGVVAVRRPSESGTDFDEVLRICLELLEKTRGRGVTVTKPRLHKIIYLIGAGCGFSSLTREASEAIASAELIVGASRVLKEQFPEETVVLDGEAPGRLPVSSSGKRLLSAKPSRIAEILRGYCKEAEAAPRDIPDEAPGKTPEAGSRTGSLAKPGAAGEAKGCGDGDTKIFAVLFSGDSGFYSGTRLVLSKIKNFEDADSWEIHILPGISSLQLFAARLGVPWQAWNLVSAHGRRVNTVREVMDGKWTFFLTGGAYSPAAICGELEAAGLGDLSVCVGENLGGGPEERVRCGTAEAFAGEDFEEPAVLLVSPAPNAPGRPRTGIPDEEFLRGKAPMTKSEVRSVILSKLAPSREEILWDIGAGTGSVSVELGLAAGQVWAFERKYEALKLIEENRRRFGAFNVIPVIGTAPDIFYRGKLPESGEDGEREPEILAADQEAVPAENRKTGVKKVYLSGQARTPASPEEVRDKLRFPAPDKVFIGGSGGRLPEIVEAVREANAKAVICVSAICLETLEAAQKALSGEAYDTEVVQISISRGENVGGLTMLKAQNPVFLLTSKPRETEG